MMDCERITEYFGAVYEGESDARIEKMVKDHLDPALRVGKITSGMA